MMSESADGTLVNAEGTAVVDAFGNVFTLVLSTKFGFRVAVNGAVDATTTNVAFIGYFQHQVYQENRAGIWSTWNGAAWVAAADPRGGTRGAFRIAGGQIIDPSGSAFKAKGINLTREQISIVSTNIEGEPLLTMFPGLNCVRVTFQFYDLPSAIAPFIDQMTHLKIVTIIVDNTATGQQPYTGFALASQIDWYTSMASAFVGNPYVWFGSLNESSPVTSGIGDDVTTSHLQIYNTIRQTGNNTIVHLCMIGGGDPASLPGANTQSVLTGPKYATLKNIVWDYHAFGYSFPSVGTYSTNQTDIATSLQYNVNHIQSITSADGIVPVLIGEFGESTDGDTIDWGSVALVNAVGMSGYGFLAWAFSSGGTANNLVDRAYNISSYGQQVASLIASQ